MSDLQCPATILLIAHESIACGGGAAVGGRQAMDHLADLHRGETIAVIATREMIDHALGDASVPADTIAVAIDASGWSVSPGGR